MPAEHLGAVVGSEPIHKIDAPVLESGSPPTWGTLESQCFIEDGRLARAGLVRGNDDDESIVVGDAVGSQPLVVKVKGAHEARWYGDVADDLTNALDGLGKDRRLDEAGAA
jgi:hypothetical protein